MSETRTRKKTNLMVFLRPVVVRDSAAVDTLSLDRYELMRAGQREQQPVSSPMLPIDSAPVLPAAPAARSQPPAAAERPTPSN